MAAAVPQVCQSFSTKITTPAAGTVFLHTPLRDCAPPLPTPASTQAKSQSLTVADIHVTKPVVRLSARPTDAVKLVIHRADHRTSKGAEQCAVSGAICGKLWRSCKARLARGPGACCSSTAVLSTMRRSACRTAAHGVV